MNHSPQKELLEHSMKQTTQLKDRPFVFVRCLTYNHEPYIEDALKGFAMQKTDFPFLAVVIDDCSTDGTADIVRKYEAMYPDIIKGIYLPYNFRSAHEDKRPYYQEYVDKATYWAECEGDDYWTDPYKLQKQVDFLESHPNYSMCFHAAKVKLEGVNKSKIGAQCEKLETREYFTNDMFASWIVPTASIVYNIKMFDSYKLKHPEWLTRTDIAWVLTCAHVGRVWGMGEQMSVYRMQPNSVSHNPAIRGKEIFKLPNHFRSLYINFPELNKADITWCISNAYYGRMKRQKNPFKFIRDFVLFVYWNPRYAWSKIKQLVTRKKV